MYKKSLILFTALIFLSGCANVPVRKQARFDRYFDSGGTEKTVTVMPIDIKFYKLTAGGISEQMDEWDKQADELFRQEIIKRLDPSSKIKIKILDESSLDEDARNFVDEQNGLYRAVAQSIIAHTYTPGNIFSQKLTFFDYTLGTELSRLNDSFSTDALLFFSGSRTYWTGGRVFLATWGILLGAATGVSVIPAGVPDWVAVALVDAKTGDVLWFRYFGQPNVVVGDLRQEKIVSDTVEYLFREMPK
ncbi:MAG: hypothetical protein PHN59_00345 [Candidatus Omnitrophica bacterium]|nr:hypothetical protein [Candidatus Omnitrophota bacterium]